MKILVVLTVQNGETLLRLVLIQNIDHSILHALNGLRGLVLVDQALRLEEAELLALVRGRLVERVAESLDGLDALLVVLLHIVAHDHSHPELAAAGQLADQLLVAATVPGKVAVLGMQSSQVDDDLQIGGIAHGRHGKGLARLGVVPTAQNGCRNALCVTVEEAQRLPAGPVLGVEEQR